MRVIFTCAAPGSYLVLEQLAAAVPMESPPLIHRLPRFKKALKRLLFSAE
jgi:hypothetical protein